MRNATEQGYRRQHASSVNHPFVGQQHQFGAITTTKGYCERRSYTVWVIIGWEFTVMKVSSTGASALQARRFTQTELGLWREVAQSEKALWLTHLIPSSWFDFSTLANRALHPSGVDELAPDVWKDKTLSFPPACHRKSLCRPNVHSKLPSHPVEVKRVAHHKRDR